MSKTLKEKKEEQQIKHLIEMITRCGAAVRRENLTRGHAFKVKSGDCVFTDKPTIFVDKRLPFAQQVSVLSDYIVDLKIEPTKDDEVLLPEALKELLKAQKSNAAAV